MTEEASNLSINGEGAAHGGSDGRPKMGQSNDDSLEFTVLRWVVGG